MKMEVCCETPPKSVHEDAETRIGQDTSLSSSITSGTTTALPNPANDSHQVATLTSSPSTDLTAKGDSVSMKSKEIKTSQAKKKTVRINAEPTLIPLLTSASFFRKTPKPTTITSSGYGIIPSFRIIAPSAIASELNSKLRSKSTEQMEEDDSTDDGLVSKASLWWTKEERREILQTNQKASRDFKRFQPTKIRKANLVYHDIVMDCCCRNGSQEDEEHYDDHDIYASFQRERRKSNTNGAPSPNGATERTSTHHSSTKKRKRTNSTPASKGESDLLPPTMSIPDYDATIDLPTNVRGLEWGVMPDAKRYRKAHARTVMRWQDRFRRMNMNDRRRRRRIGHDSDFEDMDSSEGSSSSFSSDDDTVNDSGSDHKKRETTSHHRDQQDLLLGEKASVSSLRSCILARVFGKSDYIAANPAMTTASDLEENRSSSWSPTPSLTGTTDESESSGNDEDDADSNDDDSDSENDSESDSDSDEDEDGQANTVFKSLTNRSGSYSTSLSMNPNSHRRMFRPRMFRPRMMPPR